MKNYTITVNGTSYDVTVEEKGGSAVQTSSPAPASKPAPKPSSGSKGGIKVEAGAAGKVFKIVSNIGDSLKKGDTVVILEAMKMEIPVVAPSDGTVASIDVSVGDSVESGALLATLN